MVNHLWLHFMSAVITAKSMFILGLWLYFTSISRWLHFSIDGNLSYGNDFDLDLPLIIGRKMYEDFLTVRKMRL